MLKGQELGRALDAAMKLKGVGSGELAQHFHVKSPSVSGWKKNGRIDKRHIDDLVNYFSDVVPPSHWGINIISERSARSKMAQTDTITEKYPIDEQLVRDVLLHALGELKEVGALRLSPSVSVIEAADLCTKSFLQKRSRKVEFSALTEEPPRDERRKHKKVAAQSG